jgi:hypothetical protein
VKIASVKQTFSLQLTNEGYVLPWVMCRGPTQGPIVDWSSVGRYQQVSDRVVPVKAYKIIA